MVIGFFDDWRFRPWVLLGVPVQQLSAWVRRGAARRARSRRPALDSVPDVTRCETVRHQGEAIPCQSVVAPLSGKPVVGYRVLLEARFEETGPFWHMLIDETRVAPFEIPVAGGTVRVAPGERGRLGLPRAQRSRMTSADVFASPTLRQLLRRAGVSSQSLISARAIRVTEHCFEPHQHVRVCGTPRFVNAAEAGYRAEARQLELVPPPGGELWIEA